MNVLYKTEESNGYWRYGVGKYITGFYNIMFIHYIHPCIRYYILLCAATTFVPRRTQLQQRPSIPFF